MRTSLIKPTFFLIPTFLLASCDGLVGEKGVVEDIETGERIPNVIVKMESAKGAYKEDMTDSIGYFNVVKLVPGGLGNWEDYTITFEKDGYEITTIDENYYQASTTEFVTEGTKDTLIVKMQPN